MPQLHFYVPEETAAALRRKAKAKDVSLSKFIAEIVAREISDDAWPEGFFTDVAGSWQGTVEEPEDFELEERTAFDVSA